MRWSVSSGLPELLCPAGSRERLEAAVHFGADAVYLAGKEFGMRSGSPNFGPDELASAVEYAHCAGVRVYLACNNLMNNADCEKLPGFLRMAQNAGVDAVIVTCWILSGSMHPEWKSIFPLRRGSQIGRLQKCFTILVQSALCLHVNCR